MSEDDEVVNADDEAFDLIELGDAKAQTKQGSPLPPMWPDWAFEWGSNRNG